MTAVAVAYHGEPQIITDGRVSLIVQPYSFMGNPFHTSLVVQQLEPGADVHLKCDDTTIVVPHQFIPLLMQALQDIQS